MDLEFDEDNTDGMEMPCPCQKCGAWFDLQEGASSDKWFPNTVICEKCGNEESEEMERDEEIQDLKTELEDLEHDLKHLPPRIEELKAKITELEKKNYNS